MELGDGVAKLEERRTPVVMPCMIKVRVPSGEQEILNEVGFFG